MLASGSIPTLNRLVQHRTFFNLPLEKKKQLLYVGGGQPARGFTPSHSEKTFLHIPELSKAAPDAAETREQFTLGPPEDKVFPTLWFEDKDLDATFSTLRSFYSTCRDLGLKLMQAIELGLSLRPVTLTSHYLPDAAEMTLNWYPAASREALLRPNLKRIWPHSDLGIISLLFQDGVGGLEFEDREHPGQFVPVKPAAPTELIINASDTIERWTNGVISAGVHRVNVPAAMREANEEAGSEEIVPERRSIVMLYRAKGETSVGPLADFVNSDQPARFSEMTALEYLAVKNKLTFEDVSNQKGQTVSA